jgi:purine-binding chemotaxis protein CheW
MSNNHSHVQENGAFDWQNVHRRLEEARTALEGLEATDSQTAQQIMARRAARLAATPPQEEEGEQTHMAVVRLERELYGLELDAIVEIWPLERVTRVPRAPTWVAGVVNLRGRILPVVDLRRFLNLPEDQGKALSSEASNYLVVARTQDMECALMVQDILTVERIPLRRIQEAGDDLRGLPPRLVRGLMEHQVDEKTKMVVVLDLPALLDDESFIIHEELM